MPWCTLHNYICLLNYFYLKSMTWLLNFLGNVAAKASCSRLFRTSYLVWMPWHLLLQLWYHLQCTWLPCHLFPAVLVCTCLFDPIEQSQVMQCNVWSTIRWIHGTWVLLKQSLLSGEVLVCTFPLWEWYDPVMSILQNYLLSKTFFKNLAKPYLQPPPSYVSIKAPLKWVNTPSSSAVWLLNWNIKALVATFWDGLVVSRCLSCHPPVKYHYSHLY